MTDSTTAPLALVTGASAGIGRELARELAEQGFDLVVAAEDERIDTAAQELRALGGRVEPVRADLRRGGDVDALYRAATAVGPLDVAVVNAGVGQGGPFVETAMADELSVVDLNVRSSLQLTKLALHDMVRRGEGRVLITSSIASTMPGAHQATYNASKSFLQSLAEAVQEELRDTGVTVTSLMPGPTETEFFVRAGMTDTPIGAGSKDDPADVARQGVRAMLRGEDKIVAGSPTTKLQGHVNALLPDRLKAALHARMAKPGGAG